MKETLRRFWPLIKDYKFYFLLVLLGIIMISGSTVATAQIMEPAIDDMFIKKDEQMIYIIPILVVVIYFIKSVGRYMQSVTMNYIGQSIVTRLRTIMLEKMLSLDIAFLNDKRNGELISRITGDITRIQYFVSNMLPDFVRESITVVALVSYVIYLNPMLSFYALVVLPTVIYPLILIAKRLKRLSHRSQEKNADAFSKLTDVFNNAEVIKANSTEKYEVEHYDKLNWSVFKINMKSVFTNELVSPTLETIGAFGIAAVMFMGAYEVYEEKMTVGEFSAFLTAVGLVFQPIKKIGSIYGQIQDSLAASERIFDIQDRQPSITDGPLTLKDDIHTITFKNATLNYGDISALQQISYTMQQPQTIALVGDSGAGKSSLINLLIRFYDLSSGELLINGENIKNYKQHSLREQIAIVSQRVYIFQDTLAANVAYGHPIDEERINKALELADALDFVASLKEGIYTVMSEFGANLSGGQRQRIAIARAIYKHASVLILDEATSALDNKSERRIKTALEAYTKDKLTIMIAHRLSTVEHADAILVLKGGKIDSIGTHSELLEHSNEYKRLAGSMIE